MTSEPIIGTPGPRGASILCFHCHRQPSRIVRLEDSRLVFLCELHYVNEYKVAKLQ